MIQNFKNSITIESSIPEEVQKEAEKYCMQCCKNPEYKLLGEICDSRKKKTYDTNDSILERKQVTAFVKCNCCNKISKILYSYEATYNSYKIDNVEIFKFRGGIEKIQKQITINKPLLEISCMDDNKLSNLYILDLKNVGTREVFKYSYLFVYV